MNVFKMIQGLFALALGLLAYKKGKDSANFEKEKKDNQARKNTINSIREAREDEQKIMDTPIELIRQQLYDTATKRSTKRKPL